jgi:hypothetical protein
MPTKFTWSSLRDASRHDPRPLNFRPDPAAIARREARDAAENHLWKLQQPWIEAACSRRQVHEGAEMHWLEYTVRPKAKEIIDRIQSCATDEARQKLADEILEELRRADRGFIRGGGAAMSAVIDASEIAKGFLTDAIVINNNEVPRRPG